jgi:hypothetical protein
MGLGNHPEYLREARRFWRTYVLSRRAECLRFQWLCVPKIRFWNIGGEGHRFQTFEIHSRVIGWDSKWVFFEHRFVRKDRVIGVVAGRAVLKAQSGPIDPQVLSAELGHSAPSPELAEWVRCFDQSAELLGELLRNEERSKGILSAIQSPRYPQKRKFGSAKQMSRHSTHDPRQRPANTEAA